MTDTQSLSLPLPLQFSEHLAAIVAAAARSVVSVHGGGRRPLSGMVWQPGIAVTAVEFARVVFFIFIILFVFSLILHLIDRSKLP